MSFGFPYREVNNCLLDWAQNDPPIQDFTVENVLQEIGIDITYYDSMFRYLMSKRDFELIPGKMLLCPNNHKNEVLPFDSDLEEEFDCFICGEVVECTPNNFIPVFSFTEEFRSNAIELKKKNLHKINIMNPILV